MRVGLTGGIGTGKSTVSKRLSQLGLPVLDADAISRKLLDVDGGCYHDAIQLFGTGILNCDGTIDRAVVARIVFTDEEKRNALNQLIHPAVWREMDAAARTLEEQDPLIPIIFDVPLLMESGWHERMDLVVLVTCTEEQVLNRVMKRDGSDYGAILSRMNAQMPQDEKVTHAHIILDNSGTVDQLNLKVDQLYQDLFQSGIRKNFEA